VGERKRQREKRRERDRERREEKRREESRPVNPGLRFERVEGGKAVSDGCIPKSSTNILNVSQLCSAS
jgi:hypothetical protein